MKINHPIKIDLLEFIRTGKFDYLQLGQTRAWVLNHFPDPDGFKQGDNWRRNKFEIFTYGNFELHFYQDILYLIFSDNLDLDGGPSLKLTNQWILEKEEELTLPYVINELLKEKIDFRTFTDDSLFSIKLQTIGKTILHFETEEISDPQQYKLNAIWLSNSEIPASSS